MSYQWKVGELAVCKGMKTLEATKLFPTGSIHIVDGFWSAGAKNPRDGGKLAEDTLSFIGIDPLALATNDTQFGWKAERFRPLHGTDIRKLEEKYPEYIIKTNEVEG